MYCENLTNPINGIVRLQSTIFESNATYECSNETYVLVGESSRKCGADGNWTGSEPTCECKPEMSL